MLTCSLSVFSFGKVNSSDGYGWFSFYLCWFQHLPCRSLAIFSVVFWCHVPFLAACLSCSFSSPVCQLVCLSFASSLSPTVSHSFFTLVCSSCQSVLIYVQADPTVHFIFSTNARLSCFSNCLLKTSPLFFYMLYSSCNSRNLLFILS